MDKKLEKIYHDVAIRNNLKKEVVKTIYDHLFMQLRDEAKEKKNIRIFNLGIFYTWKK